MDQSDSKTAVLGLGSTVILKLTELHEAYVEDLKRGDYSRSSVEIADNEVRYFISWLAGERKQNKRAS